LAYINKRERELLVSFRRPIVLLTKKPEYNLPDNVGPGLNNIGIILPYTGIHYLLFDKLGDIPLIFTSGNISNIPMAITPQDVIDQLSTIADAYLLHNRVIYQRCDDSVVRVHDDKEKIIRRSRGYVPEYIPLPFSTKIEGLLAVGPELSLTGLVARGYRLFPTQHIGNGTSLEIYNYLKDAILHLKSLLKLKDPDIKIITHDMHPLFNSTMLAQEFKIDLDQKLNKNEQIMLVPVQHHYAHIASLMVDCGVLEHKNVVGVSLDGVGYGIDERIWGGEIISGTYADMVRECHLSYIPMIGGDICTKYPTRMVIGFLLIKYGLEETQKKAEALNLINHLNYGNTEFNTMLSFFKSNENIALTSSCGRFFDAISSLLDVCQLKTYSGEPAVRLEGIASLGNPNTHDFYSQILEESNKPQFDGIIHHENIIGYIVELMLQLKKDNPKKIDLTDKERADIAASVFHSIGIIFAKISIKIAKRKKIKYIGLSGGVAYNCILSKAFYDTLKSENTGKIPFNILEHHNVPPGDAGISIGQAAIAIAQFNKNNK
jgi:hydrogenase maturation protein HypF